MTTPSAQDVAGGVRDFARSTEFRAVMLDAQRTLFKPRTITTQAELTQLTQTATDGDELYVLADSANGVRWRFRYNASSTSAYRWENVGEGSFIESKTDTTTVAVSTYTDPASGAMTTWTLPLSGDYLIEHGAQLGPGSAGNGMFCSFSVSGATALDADGCLAYGGAAVAPGQWNVAFAALKTGLAAGTTIQPKYKAQGAVAGNLVTRFIKITPRRVG